VAYIVKGNFGSDIRKEITMSKRQAFWMAILSALVMAAFITVMFVMIKTVQAQEQPLCADRATVVGQLSEQYSETPAVMGLANNGGVMEVLSSDDDRTWTIILTMPNGVSCMVAAGENLEILPTKPKVAGINH